ncbi:hypothetical protein ACJU26_09770 [Acidithiobacillus sp. M4-SHS-6]|uniref:hypothetical protein n=1 Tax=Acidithiobacillus sp. M4-SHS-6 TaxID=3383024 RepID=UPI0039BEB404
MPDDIWDTAREHRERVIQHAVVEEMRLLRFLDTRLQQLAFEIPQWQKTKNPVTLSFFLCDKHKPCTHCPHPQWIRWVPNPRKWGAHIPSRVEHPGRVMRDSKEALVRYREALKLMKIRQDILTLQTTLTRKIYGQIAARMGEKEPPVKGG